MNARILRPVFACLLASHLAAGCSDGAGGSGSERPAAREPEPREFSAEDKRVARALSIGNAAVAGEADNPYRQALSCSLALETLAARLDEMELLDAAQSEVLDEARATYQRRASLLADEQDSSDDAPERDRLQQADQGSEPQMQMQRAIGCLRQLL